MPTVRTPGRAVTRSMTAGNTEEGQVHQQVQQPAAAPETLWLNPGSSNMEPPTHSAGSRDSQSRVRTSPLVPGEHVPTTTFPAAGPSSHYYGGNTASNVNPAASLLGMGLPPPHAYAWPSEPRNPSVSNLQYANSNNVNPNFNCVSNVLPQYYENVNPNYANNLPMQRNFSKILEVLPKFDGNSVNPVDFVNRLEQTISLCDVPFAYISLYAHNLFLGKAKIWADALLHTYPDFNTFKTAFLQQFWGHTRQTHLKLQLEVGKYNGQLSYVEYFLSQIAAAKHLQGYSEIELVALVTRHYPPVISASLIGTRTIAEALDRLRLAENYETNFDLSKSSSQNKPSSSDYANIRGRVETNIRGQNGKYFNKNFTERKLNCIGEPESYCDLENATENS